ncbi:hypothetical protein POVWA2_014510 [Plasmodium ovale wallikeri]|uniref:Uncharacterized protein n=1 Tax=Plasmodium ovale wallikeri TaxID=864142 RepID=A0A1A8YN52_PLAOA|nr:hypothetical protein POVWA1_014690 [Plasmodium ovale wallikeri]SBT33390.1 hypothetical protein POVWA2_014510 [Plasmodium ovale wallikeri]
MNQFPPPTPAARSCKIDFSIFCTEVQPRYFIKSSSQVHEPYEHLADATSESEGFNLKGGKPKFAAIGTYIYAHIGTCVHTHTGVYRIYANFISQAYN